MFCSHFLRRSERWLCLWKAVPALPYLEHFILPSHILEVKKLKSSRIWFQLFEMMNELHYLINKIILLSIMCHREFCLLTPWWEDKPWNIKKLRGGMDNLLDITEDKSEKVVSSGQVNPQGKYWRNLGSWILNPSHWLQEHWSSSNTLQKRFWFQHFSKVLKHLISRPRNCQFYLSVILQRSVQDVHLQ